MKMTVGSDRKTVDLGRLGRLLVNAIPYLVLVMLICLAYVVGYDEGVGRSCESGYLIGNSFYYTCINQELVGVCLYGDRLVVGPSWPFNLTLDNQTE